MTDLPYTQTSQRQELLNGLDSSLLPSERNADGVKLIQAAINNDVDAMQKLLDLDPQIDLEYETGRPRLSAFSASAYVGSVEAMDWLLAQNINTSHRLANTSALAYAILGGHVEVAKRLLENNEPFFTLDSDSRLTAAVKSGSLEMVDFILKLGDDINDRGDTKITPIMAAAATHTSGMTDFLLQRGAKIVNDNRSVLNYAVVCCNLEMLQDLIYHGADVNFNEFGVLPIYRAISRGYTGAAQLLIANGADVNLQGTDTKTALMQACYQGMTEVVQAILAKDPDINKVCDNATALTLAANSGHYDVVKLLLEAGADVHLAPGTSVSPIILAAKHSMKMVKLMMEHGADINQRVNDTTPLLNAIQSGKERVAKLLINLGADLNAQDNQGNHTLLTAINKNQDEIAELLVLKGADLALANTKGEQAAMRAKAMDIPNVLAAIEHKRLLNAAGSVLNHQDGSQVRTRRARL